MRYLIVSIVMLCAACASSGYNVVPLAPDAANRLAAVKFIYIDVLGSDDGAGLVREKIRARLAACGAVKVVETREKADAVLTGTAGVETRQYRGTTGYAGYGIFRLVELKTDETIWSYEYKRGFMLAGSVSSRVANQVVDQLLKTAGHKR
jgi:hypothetical protein